MTSRKPSRKPPARVWQRMLSGRRLDLLDPSPVDVEVEDIAHGLARVARWNGQTIGEHPYSVAEHSLLVEQIFARIDPKAPVKWRLAALLHDVAKPRTRAKSDKTNDWTFYHHEKVGADMADRWLRDYRFSNSEREDGLLAVAKAGIVFVPGGPGTLQEVFQDAAQNAYETYGRSSPMVFLDPPADDGSVELICESTFHPAKGSSKFKPAFVRWRYRKVK